MCTACQPSWLAAACRLASTCTCYASDGTTTAYMIIERSSLQPCAAPVVKPRQQPPTTAPAYPTSSLSYLWASCLDPAAAAPPAGAVHPRWPEGSAAAGAWPRHASSPPLYILPSPMPFTSCCTGPWWLPASQLHPSPGSLCHGLAAANRVLAVFLCRPAAYSNQAPSARVASYHVRLLPE